MLLKVWILTVVFGISSEGVSTEQYTFKTREECVAASSWYSKQHAAAWPTQKPMCYPSYVQVK